MRINRIIIRSLLLCLTLFWASWSSAQPLLAHASQDILSYLQAIPGMEAEELNNPPSGYRYILIRYSQPIDHERPWLGSFKQRMVLLHKDQNAPMVLATNGYTIAVSTYRYNLTQVLNANQLKIEHRFFAESTPEPKDWQYLTIKQAAADHHRIVTAIRPFYTGKWISRGSSKGGMTAIYHRRFYPDDVDGTVANVAPQSFGRLDPRYVTFQQQVGPAGCRAALKQYQRELLKRRDIMKAYIQRYSNEQGMNFSLEGGLDQVLDMTVGELYFQFWQYGDIANCKDIPTNDASDADLFQFMVDWGPLYFLSDIGRKTYEPYFYQAITQLGYPRLMLGHITDLLQYDPNDYRPYVSKWPSQAFDYRAMWDIANFVVLKSSNLMLFYGDIDPWTAGAFFLPNSGRRSTHSFWVKDGNHGTDILTVSEEDQKKAFAMLKQWTGIEAKVPSVMLRHTGQDSDNQKQFNEDLIRRPL
ncbi:S28 family serine protease [Zooshikella ganghwensis]|uniref:S28 family serine protease n=1 Tax=Zooshikella ganghwensis TaxID=202772 RepID=UPI00041488D7|nr:S28 family serine protease [Zooshikella ganghwensis]